MALIKSVMTNMGIPAEYHHICAIAWEKGAPQMQVQLAGFPSAEVRAMPGVVPMGRANIMLPATDAPPALPDVYAAVKALPAWADAQDHP